MRNAAPSRRARANRPESAIVLTTALLIAALLTAALLTGCDRDPVETTIAVATPPASQVLSVRQPAARVGDLSVFSPQAVILPVSGAIYLSIKNLGARDDRLLGASSATATAIEMHESFEQAGVMRMQAHPEGFVVTAGQTLELAPGGKHLMMVEPKALPTAPTANETPSLELTLHFEVAGDLVLQVPVVDPTTVLQSQGASA